MAAILKNVKCNIFAAVWPISTRFVTMMHIRLATGQQPKIWKSKMEDGGHLKNKKIMISPKPFGGFWWNIILHDDT